MANKSNKAVAAPRHVKVGTGTAHEYSVFVRKWRSGVDNNLVRDAIKSTLLRR